MAVFMIHALDHPGSAELRAKLRPEHLAFIEPLDREGKVQWAGPCLDEAGGMIGSLIVYEVEDRAALDAIVAQDPYVTGGLFASVTIFPVRRIFPRAS